MIKVVFFDKIILFFILAAFFTTGFHIVENKVGEKKYHAEVTVKIEKISGIPSSDILVDGKYGCTLMSFDENEIIFFCDGFLSEAGFLLSGAKYLSKNQPIKAFSGTCYFEGRIIFISPKPSY